MTTNSLSDLRSLFYGVGSAAEYQFLLNAVNQGITASNLLNAPVRKFKSGLYYGPSPDGSDGTLTAGQDTVYAMPFEVGKTTSFNLETIEVTTAQAASTVRLGIYRDGGNSYPSTLQFEAGTDSAATTGIKEISISQQLTPGLWWLALVVQGSAAVAVRSRSTPSQHIGQLTGGNVNAVAYAQSGVNGALPATFTSTVTVVQNGPKIMLRAA